jgi:hypothetical protein
METFWNILSVIIALAAVVLFVYVIVKSAFDWSRKSALPVVNMHARVASKRSEEIPSSKKKKSACFVTFENDEGAAKELSVTPKEFQQLSVGDMGTLTYRADLLLSFEISSPAEEDLGNAE